MPIDPITVAMLTALTTPPFADRALRAKLNKLLTGKDVFSYQLDDAWKAGRKAFVDTLGTLGYETDSIQDRLDAMFASDAFHDALARLPVHDPGTVKSACAEHFYARVLPQAMEGTFEHAWQALVFRFQGTVSQSPELKNLIDLTRAARREQQDAERDARDEAKVEKLSELVALVEKLLAVKPTTTHVSVDNQIAIHIDSPDPYAESREQLRNYLGWVMKESGALWLSGIDRGEALESDDTEISYGSAMRLDAVYTALLTHGGGERDLKRAAEQMMEKDREPVPALRQLDEHRNLVLLGDPGSGKSTFVNFVALCMAGEVRGDGAVGLPLLTAPLPWAGDEAEDGEEPQPQPWNHGALLPLRVVLRDFAARGLPAAGERGTAGHLWTFIEGELASTSLGEIAPVLKRSLERGEVIVLLDGLDEVPEADARRERIVQSIDDFVSVHGDCRFLVTCRTYAYQHQRWQLREFTTAELLDWQLPQIGTFVDRWYAHSAEIGRSDAPEERAELLKRAIEARPSLGELAERPLLLTLMASLHAWRGGELPDRRVELYNEAVDLLLERWQKRQMIRNPQTGRLQPGQPSLAEWLDTDRRAVRRELEELACAAHRAQPDLEGTADIAEQDLIAALMRVRRGDADVRYGQLVNFLSHRAGLLMAHGVGVYSFVHRTFQEYLAACHLTRCDFPYELADRAREDPDRWREVVLLAAAKAAEGAPATVWLVVQELLPGDGDDPLAQARSSHLAGLVLAESSECQALAGGEKRVERHRTLFDQLRRWQLRNLEGDLLKARDRAECGHSLALFGDLRPSVLEVEAMEWCWVPAGGCRLGNDAGYSWEQPAHGYEIPYGYWLSRFPVTNAQYQSFVDVGGYRNEAYWQEAREHGLWDGAFLLDGDPVTGPGRYGAPFALPTHPVVGVSWYESKAFCRWLGERLGSASLLPEGWTVDLPSEPEWEKGARGGVRIPVEPLVRTLRSLAEGETRVEDEENPDPERLYPWGMDENLERMNVLGTKIESTSAVGCFSGGASRHGCEEMSGNVWEWTRSQYRDYPYPDVGKAASIESSPSADASLVLRGGGFPDFPFYARCSFRYLWVLPRLRSGAVGFRPVLRPSAYLYL